MTCVIVGAGFAGVKMALKLQKKNRPFLLISVEDYFHLNPAAVRVVSTEGWAEKTLIPLSPCFGDSFKKGKVVKIVPAGSGEEEEGGGGEEEGAKKESEEGKVILESGEEITYKYLVIATGSTHKWPVKLSGMAQEEAIDEYKKINQRVSAAKSIVIIGGGATGCEIAAEMRHFHPDKEVTLIHSSASLLHPDLTARSQNKLQDILTRELGVKLVLNQRVTNLDDLPITGPGTVTTDQSTNIEADVLIKSIGLQISTSAYKDGLESAMTERGELVVDEYFRVGGFPNIFAMGDSAKLAEPKLLAYAMKHGEAMAQTIINLDKGKQPVKYKPYSLPLLTGISLGPKKGFARTKGDWTFPAFLIVQMKGKDMFTKQWWSDLKQKMPTV